MCKGQNKQCAYDVTLTRVHVTIDAMCLNLFIMHGSACTILYCHLWLVYLYSIFPHYIINGTIFGIKLLKIKCLF